MRQAETQSEAGSRFLTGFSVTISRRVSCSAAHQRLDASDAVGYVAPPVNSRPISAGRHHETDLSTQPAPPQAPPRIPGPRSDEGRQEDSGCAPLEGSQEVVGLTCLKRLPQTPLAEPNSSAAVSGGLHEGLTFLRRGIRPQYGPPRLSSSDIFEAALTRRSGLVSQ